MARDFVAAFVYKGYAMAARMDTTITTISISVKVNPKFLRIFFKSEIMKFSKHYIK
jgi:hypothetical protein